MSIYRDTINIISESLQSIDDSLYAALLESCYETVKKGNRIIISGLGKNGGVCNKVVDSMTSIGINAEYVHTGEALHGSLGRINDGDLVILTSKSGNTHESIQMAKALKGKKCNTWCITFNSDGELVRNRLTDHALIMKLEQEGDPWNLMPMNSVSIILITLQCLTLELIDRLGLQKEDFLKNHPGGNIGKVHKI